MIKELLKREVTKQFLRFCLVGIESTIFTYLIYLLFFHFFGFTYAFSYVPGVVLGTLFGFYFNKSFSFESREEIKKSLFIYLGVYAFSLTIGGFFLKLLVNKGGLHPLIAIIPVLIFTTIVNFLGTKILAFKNMKW
jgi:putative flippase GtrA